MQVVPLHSPEQEGSKCLPYVNRVDELVPDAELLVEKLFARPPDDPPACIISDMFLGWTQASKISPKNCNRKGCRASRKTQHY